MPRKSPLPPALVRQLQNLLAAENLLTDPADCWSYGYDNSRLHSPPAAVVFPLDHDQVLELVLLCNQHGVPLTARGRGTGTTGATVPCDGGIVVSLERMCTIVEFCPDDRYIRVQPGVTNLAVQEIAGKSGFFWPPDPTSAAFCSIGGNLAYNSAGPRAVKYGTPRENTLGLKAVTGAGHSLTTGVCTTKGVVGYDLTRLLIGSEGTLAIITEATLRLTPAAETRKTLRATYASMDSAARAIARIMSQPCIPCALEFMDQSALEIISRYSPLDLPSSTRALLMIEVDGSREGIAAAVNSIRHAADVENGLIEIRVAESAEETGELWKTRKSLSPALRRAAAGKINEDVVVPVSRIPELIEQLQSLSEKYNLPIVNFGHAGNGNIHVNILYNPADNHQTRQAHHCLDEIFDLVLELHGTLSGEHGTGLVKRDYLPREIEPHTLELMQRIKLQFDPNGILNPDKLYSGIPEQHG